MMTRNDEKLKVYKRLVGKFERMWTELSEAVARQYATIIEYLSACELR
jgi:hypothetical protein